MREVWLLVDVVSDAAREVEVPVHTARRHVAPGRDDPVVLARQLGLVVLGQLDQLAAAPGEDAAGVAGVGDVELGSLDERRHGRAADVARVQAAALQPVGPADGLQARETLGVEKAVVGVDVRLGEGGFHGIVVGEIDTL